jgi:hypothetical protein
MTLLAIAEVMSGEALVSPGGPIDRDTAIADDFDLWQRVLDGDVEPAATEPGGQKVRALREELVASI